MEFIPAIRFENRKIQTTPKGNYELVEGFLEKKFEEDQIYLLDSDGLKRDKPNLCSYPKISEKYDIWVDSMPKTVGDVIHLLTAGANSIVVRENLWKERISEIKELTENKILAGVDIKTLNEFERGFDALKNADGIIILNNKGEIDFAYENNRILKNLSNIHPVYVYETDKKNLKYWEKKGIYGLLVDIENLKEFKNAV